MPAIAEVVAMKSFENEAKGYIKDMFIQSHMLKRCILSLISVIIMGLGTSLFAVSGFGVDPFTSMNMNISSALGISFGTYQLIVNAIVLLYVLIVAHRGLIGVGTVVNMVGVGYSCEMFQSMIKPMVSSIGNNIVARLFILAAGIIVLCFSCSLFFTSNVGIGPYDCIGFMLSRKTKIPYKWIRVATDIFVICVGLAASGGVYALLNGDFSNVKNIGIGTIITAFMMGPLVNFFSKHVSSKILNIDYAELSREVAFFMIKGAMLKNKFAANENPAHLNINSNAFEVLKEI